MKIKFLKIKGFKCFNDEIKIDLNDFTSFVGNNGNGKTAILEALCRVFSVDKSQRNIRNTDFYIANDEVIESKSKRELYIEIIIDLTEDLKSESSREIPEVFKNMIVEGPKEIPFCRVRLEATWEKTTIPGGDIKQEVYWITSDEHEIKEDDKIKMSLVERSRIQVHYIPAARDPEKQLKKAKDSILYKLLNAVKWDENFPKSFSDATDAFNKIFSNHKGVQTIQNTFSKNWNDLYKEKLYKNIKLSPISSNISELLLKIETRFYPNVEEGGESIDRLSDGMKSLFYFTLITSLFKIEKLMNDEDESHGMDSSQSNDSYITIFCLEEPENHLAPHYLGRVISNFREALKIGNCQVLLTSHSPAILKRVEVKEIRYLLKSKDTSQVKKIILPDEKNEAHKYVKEAIKAYPELYFSKLVILGEGDSEEIIIPKIAEAFDCPMDSSFVSIVPLGGRHVNHFWRLLEDLNIPYITLLDFDRERGGGDFKRCAYVLEQLVKLRGKDKLLEEGVNELFIKKLKKKELDIEREKNAMEFMERFNVYFSYPIDIDYLMLQKFYEEYTNLDDNLRGPIIPEENDSDREDEIKGAIRSVLKKKEAFIINDLTKYTNDYPEISTCNKYEYWFYYKYLFLGRGKPVSHIHGLLNIEKNDLKDKCPEVLKKLVLKAKEILGED